MIKNLVKIKKYKMKKQYIIGTYERLVDIRKYRACKNGHFDLDEM